MNPAATHPLAHPAHDAGHGDHDHAACPPDRPPSGRRMPHADRAGAGARDPHAGHAGHAAHGGPASHRHHTEAGAPAVNLNRLAFSATLHCLTGCAIGEIAGLVIGTALGWGTLQTIGLAVALAFLSGYLMTTIPLLRAGIAPRAALKLALAADTLSILVMEIVDNTLMLVIPGAMDAGLDSALFWGSMALALAVAGAAAYPINRWLIARGQGHALVHANH